MLSDLLDEYFTPMSWLCGIVIAHWRGWPPWQGWLPRQGWFPVSYEPSLTWVAKFIIVIICSLAICWLSPTIRPLIVFTYGSVNNSVTYLCSISLGQTVWFLMKPYVKTLIYHGKVLLLGPPKFLLPTDELIETNNADEWCPICKTYEFTHKPSCCNQRICAQCINQFLIQHAKIGDDRCWFCRQQQRPDTRNFVNV